MKTIQKLFIASILSGLSISANAAVIETTSQWDGSSNVGPFGEDSISNVGQSFTFTSTVNLTSWSFFFDDSLNPDFVDFKYFVMEWDKTNRVTTGPILFESTAFTSSNNNGQDGMEKFTINTNSLTLEANKDYISFMSTIELFDGISGTSEIGLIKDPDAYTGGSYYYNNTNDISGWSNQSWGHGFYGDMAFEATFTSAVPAPAAVWLFGSGLLGLLGLARRKTHA